MKQTVWIPPLHRDLTDGVEVLTISGSTVGELIDGLEQRHPGLRDRLCVDGQIRPGISVAINGVISTRGLRQRLSAPSDIHFIPAIGGGNGSQYALQRRCRRICAEAHTTNAMEHTA